MALKANTVPTTAATNLPAFGDWAQAAGIAPPAAPSTSAAGSDDSLAKIIAPLTPGAPTAPMYTSQSGPGIVPRIHEPTMQPMAQKSQPISSQFRDLKQARRQNTFAGITNLVNAAGNEIQQRKFENLKTDIINVSRSQEQIGNAEAAMKSVEAILKPDSGASEADKKSAQETYNAAQQVLKTNKEYIETQLKDPKKQKEFAKAFDISFTDPAKNNTWEVQAGKKALEDAKKNSAAGLTSNTPEEKKVQDHLEQPKQPTTGAQPAQPAAVAAGQRSNTPYADQFLAHQPQSLVGNPLYASQLAAQQKQQNLILQHIVPQVLRNQLGIVKQQIAEGGAYARTYMQTQEKYAMGQAAIESAGKINDARIRGMLQAHDKDNATRYGIASMHVAATLGLWDNPALAKLSPTAKASLIGKAGLANMKELDSSINSSQTQIKTAEDTVFRLSHDPQTNATLNFDKLPPDVQDRITANKVFLDKEIFHQREMRDLRQQISDTIYKTQRFDPVAAQQNWQNYTPGASTNGQPYNPVYGFGTTGNPTIPNDDSAGASDPFGDEAAVVESTNWDTSPAATITVY